MLLERSWVLIQTVLPISGLVLLAMRATNISVTLDNSGTVSISLCLSVFSLVITVFLVPDVVAQLLLLALQYFRLFCYFAPGDLSSIVTCLLN